MKKILLGFVSLFNGIVASSQIPHQHLLLYKNDFNIGNNISNTSSCSPNIKHNNVNALFKGTGTGLYTNVLFGQNASVEIADNFDPPNNIFDPQGRGGKYTITMQTSNPENDLVWLTFEAKDLNPYNYLNFNLDISPTDILTSNRCGISGTITTPKVAISAYYHQNTTFNISTRGMMLASDTLVGLPPLDSFVKRAYDIYNWRNVTANLPIQQLDSDNGYVTMLIDVIQGSYTAVDNFRISSDMEPLPINLLFFTGYNQNNQHIMEWMVDGANNFSHFELEKASLSQPNQFEHMENIYYNNDQTKYSYTISGRETALYRLKLVNNDASFAYSVVLKINSNVEQSVSIKPNPVTDYITIYSSFEKGGTFKLLDIFGKVLKDELFEEHLATFNIAALHAGVYYVELTDNNSHQRIIKKIVKQ